MYGEVYNRKLFANKARAARDKLGEMGGISSIDVMYKAPMQQTRPMPAPNMPTGILASSPDLMRAAMPAQPMRMPMAAFVHLR